MELVGPGHQNQSKHNARFLTRYNNGFATKMHKLLHSFSIRAPRRHHSHSNVSLTVPTFSGTTLRSAPNICSQNRAPMTRADEDCLVCAVASVSVRAADTKLSRGVMREFHGHGVKDSRGCCQKGQRKADLRSRSFHSDNFM